MSLLVQVVRGWCVGGLVFEFVRERRFWWSRDGFCIKMIPSVYPNNEKLSFGESQKTVLLMPHGRVVARVVIYRLRRIGATESHGDHKFVN
ncbi:Aminomethyltransferase [Gossypium arboreum]|uniref:Aminomethyltransferase n=1 Tax=Gossypium arboreum TaxID=29729 RepID=A0A0B0MQE1_GOSAR|nr:Aminomethyltransferase [Gossypium arboreum]